jgi:two-component system nitrogen regulation response regulator NtrX
VPAKGRPRTVHGSVLIVDDERDFLETMREIFGQLLPDVLVSTATSGVEALTKLKAGPVDLIITDYWMPGMDGLELLVEARRIRPGLRSIMLTAHPDTDLACRATQEAQTSVVIAKPFDIEVLAGAVDFVLAENPDDVEPTHRPAAAAPKR